ncbi:hypothetical protein Poly41_19270 [Novipirellula artificiosorum]|uniref:Prenyltransferase and squalene oxidase repeat protein n=2 Tax=Novipirellula artificiosorum TaxID=2528016 RepID=A0A5C6DWI1_9BACT|nr:hypothetical protein Poly41_19270 [Novipirellula artificiosorum]
MDVTLADWIDQQQKRLNAQPIIGYARGEPAAAEPVAFAAISASAYGLKEAAIEACRCLIQAQNRHGAVSVNLHDQGPFWATSLAAIAWRTFEQKWPDAANESAKWRYRDAYRRAIDFLTGFGGEKIEPNDTFGHDSQLVGWPWVQGTHSWLEPTAMALLAMRHCGYADHPRAIEAAELLIDRQLPDGGANYGNTFVLGQELRPHLLPSAMCVVAFHRVTPRPEPIKATIRYLQNELNRPMAAISLSWVMHALVSAAWDEEDRSEIEFEWPLRSAINRLRLIEENPHRQNLLLLAAKTRESPLLNVEPHRIAPAESGVH